MWLCINYYCLNFVGIFTVIQVIDLHCKVHWPFDLANYWITCSAMLRAKIDLLLWWNAYFLYSNYILPCNCTAMVSLISYLASKCQVWWICHEKLLYLTWKFICISPIGLKLLPSGNTTFLFIGITLSWIPDRSEKLRRDSITGSSCIK